jgi:hypothetical protein
MKLEAFFDSCSMSAHDDNFCSLITVTMINECQDGLFTGQQMCMYHMWKICDDSQIFILILKLILYRYFEYIKLVNILLR